MITRRDQDIINFITDFHIATTSQIKRVFFSNTSDRYCRKRLQYLYKQGHIKRTRSTINNDYAYYINKSQQVHHDLIRTELFVNLREKYKILNWANESPFNNIRPDATSLIETFAYINDKGIAFPVFIEVHLSNKFNFEKYIELFKNNNLKEIFKVNPRVVICTDRQITIPKTNIIFKVVGLDMSGIDSIFK